MNYKLLFLPLLLSSLLLSDAVGATSKTQDLQIAQQPTQPDATRAAAEQASLEGLKLYQQGTAESLQQALAKWQIALQLWQKLDDKSNEAVTLLGIGRVYDLLGEKQQALSYYNQALPLIRAVGDRSGEATTLNNIGAVYSALGEKQQALSYYNQALPLIRAVGDRTGEARTLNNIGKVYDDLGEKQQALSYYNQALPLIRAVGDRTGEATTLNNIGSVYSDLGEKQQALSFYNQALPLRRAVGDRTGEATTLNNIGVVYSDLGEKQQALSFYNQALPLIRAVGDRFGEATTLNNIGFVYDALGEKQKALSYYNQALPLYRAVGDRTGEATTLNNIGKVYDALGEKQQALSFYNQALPLWRAVGDRSGEATTLNNIGGVYDALGEKQQALSFYNQALPLIRAVGDRSGEARTLNNIGKVYSDLGEKQQALSFFNQALPLWRAVGDRSGEATTLNNIGKVYSDLGEKQQALSFYNQALPIHRAVGARSGEANTLNNIGKVYDALGEKQQALSFYNQALPIHRAVGDRSGEANTLNNIGAVYSDLGEKQQALSFFNQALPLWRAVGDRSGEANTLNNIGLVYNALGEKQQALSYLNQALPLIRAVGDRSGEASTLNNIGLVYSDLGEKQKALSYLNQALPLIRAVGDRSGEASTLNNIGLVYSDLGEKQKALSFYNQALPIHRAVGARSGEANTLFNIAYLEQGKGNLQTALTQIEASIKIIEELRTKIDSQDLRTSYFATVQGYYQFYIDLLMQLHKKEPTKGYAAQALHISERSRARVLLELLTEANAKIRKGVDPKLLAQEQSLQEQIDARDKLRRDLISKSAPATAVQKLEQEIANLLNQYQQLQTQIRITSPKYAALKYPEPLKLAQIQQQLDANTVLLQYSLGQERSYLWVVTPNSLDSYELPPKAQIEKAANDFRQSIVRVATSPKQQAAAAKQLSQIILAPVANKLANKRLVIVADGALQNIPFAALTDLRYVSVNSIPNSRVSTMLNRRELNAVERELSAVERELSAVETRFTGTLFSHKSLTTQESYQPLLVNHEIANLPSASTIAILRQETQKRPKAPKAIAILADPVFSADDSRVTGKPENNSITPDLDLQRSALSRSARNLNRNGWDRLNGTRQEAETIFKLGSPKDSLAAYDFDANYNWVTNPQLSQYRVIHLATHGFADDVNPELSGIVLSLVDKQGKPQRGYLRLSDIFNLDFPADLIVLSACQTGQGKEVQGEGLVGLTRGLMYAGSPRLVLSLWDVDDQGTKELMSEFYRQMWKEGKTPVAALRAAQLSLWQNPNWRKPVYWAAFTMQGEWR